jgi:hypothetical protein
MAYRRVIEEGEIGLETWWAGTGTLSIPLGIRRIVSRQHGVILSNVVIFIVRSHTLCRVLFLLDFRLLWGWLWKELTSGIWHRVFRHKFTCVSRELRGSTVRVKEYAKYAVSGTKSIRSARREWKKYFREPVAIYRPEEEFRENCSADAGLKKNSERSNLLIQAWRRIQREATYWYRPEEEFKENCSTDTGLKKNSERTALLIQAWRRIQREPTYWYRPEEEFRENCSTDTDLKKNSERTNLLIQAWRRIHRELLYWYRPEEKFRENQTTDRGLKKNTERTALLIHAWKINSERNTLLIQVWRIIQREPIYWYRAEK